MIPSGVWKLLQLFSAFGCVGALLLADWNGRAARATTDPAGGGGNGDDDHIPCRRRPGNVLLSVLYPALLALMAFPWRS